MQDTCATVKIASDAPGAGGFVIINAVDFDDSIHTRFDPLDHDADGAKGGGVAAKQTKAELVEELTALQVEFEPSLKHGELLALRDKTIADRHAAAAAAASDAAS